MSAHEFHFFIDDDLAHGDVVRLTAADVDHLRVVRAAAGQRITIADSDGCVWEATIDDPRTGEITIGGERQLPRCYTTTIEVLACIFDAGKRWDALLDGVVQAGADRIVPVALTRADMTIAEKRADRAQRIVEASAKQAKRERRPIVNPVQTIPDVLAGDIGILLDPDADQQLIDVNAHGIDRRDASTVRLMIGPPAAIPADTVTALTDAGWVPAAMGLTVLRSELAAAGAVLTMVQVLTSQARQVPVDG